MGTITSSLAEEFSLADLDIKTLCNIRLLYFGLDELESGLFRIKSRPYKLLFWTITPIIYFFAEITTASIDLRIAKVEIPGIERLTSILDVKGGMSILPLANGIRVLLTLQLSIITIGPLAFIPNHVLEDWLNQATRISIDRIETSLRRRIIKVLRLLSPGRREAEVI